MLFEERDPQSFMRLLCPVPVGLDGFRSMEIGCGLPCVIAVWIALPFDQVLELPAAPVVPVVCDAFYFIFLCAFHQVWRGPCVVRSMRSCFMIGSEQGCVEDIMDGPGRR